MAKSAAGYHVLCVLKETESYESISVGLRDVIKEVSIVSRDVQECHYTGILSWGGLEISSYGMWYQLGQFQVCVHMVHVSEGRSS